MTYKCGSCKGITDNPLEKTRHVSSGVLGGALTQETVLVCPICESENIMKLKDK